MTKKVPLRRRGVPPPAGRGGREADGVGTTPQGQKKNCLRRSGFPPSIGVTRKVKKLCHTHLPAAPYSSQGGELKTGDKFPSVAGAFRPPRGGVAATADGVGLFSLSFLRRQE